MATAVVQGAVGTEAIGLERNHERLTKFDSSSEDEYKLILNVLQIMAGSETIQPSMLVEENWRIQ